MGPDLACFSLDSQLPCAPELSGAHRIAASDVPDPGVLEVPDPVRQDFESAWVQILTPWETCASHPLSTQSTSQGCCETKKSGRGVYSALNFLKDGQYVNVEGSPHGPRMDSIVDHRELVSLLVRTAAFLRCQTSP